MMPDDIRATIEGALLHCRPEYGHQYPFINKRRVAYDAALAWIRTQEGVTNMTDKTPETLRECPFCGSVNPLWEVEHLAYDWITFAVFCPICEARAAAVDTKEEAAAAWNRRDARLEPL
jgi:Lar family restriction alleviation protein